jgi:hypothetical protein
MNQLPPELRVEIRKVGEQYLAVTERASGQEICGHEFEHHPEKLVHVEPGWMLEKGVRGPHEALRFGDDDSTELAEVAADHQADEARLAAYGQRLYGYLFGDGAKLQSFLEFNDAYRRQARLTLCLYPNAAAL